jgi:hypothetical protein
MRKRIWMAMAAVAVAMAVLPAVGGTVGGATYTETWDGRGSDSLDCSKAGEGDRPDDGSGWIHWIFSTKGASTSASLTLSGSGTGIFAPGEPLVAEAWHFYTPYSDVASLGAVIELNGDAGPGGGLVISDFCPGAVEHLDVTKTAETSYTRHHDWEIDKAASTEDGYVLPCGDDFAYGADCPKVWLFTDGSGDESATWTVDARYLGAIDSDFNVSGTVTIANSGTTTAQITAIDDLLAGTPVMLDCGVTLPHALASGASLSCDYSEAVASKVVGSNVATVTTAESVYSGEAPIVWGDPTLEENATVNIDDCSDLDGCVTLGQATAPNDAQFVSSHQFAYADFVDPYSGSGCGAYQYDNTATIRETGQSASARVKVNVQCMIGSDETAWAANGTVAGQLRYTSKGNWATYVQYGGVAKTTSLFAGQTMKAGTVSFSAPTANTVTITVALDSPWSYDTVASNLKVQGYSKAPTGNPSPGGFANKATCSAVQQSCSITVPLSSFYGVHLDVTRMVPDPNFGP